MLKYCSKKSENLPIKITIAKFSGLNLAKPRFEWDCHDRLTELEHFKEDCRILFDGPLVEMKDKSKASLIINWLGRDVTQVLKLMGVEANNPEEVYETLEKVFRPESNQTLARFRLRNMKQGQTQSVDAYMSQLRLALLECKYKHDCDELLKDQFIFGIFNKESQDHLHGELSETDNSVKALYEAHKIESKLEQRKMLGIVNPTSLVGVDAIGKNSQNDKCGGKQNCPALGKTCNKCGGKTTSKLCVDLVRDLN